MGRPRRSRPTMCCSPGSVKSPDSEPPIIFDQSRGRSDGGGRSNDHDVSPRHAVSYALPSPRAHAYGALINANGADDNVNRNPLSYGAFKSTNGRGRSSRCPATPITFASARIRHVDVPLRPRWRQMRPSAIRRATLAWHAGARRLRFSIRRSARSGKRKRRGRWPRSSPRLDI